MATLSEFYRRKLEHYYCLVSLLRLSLACSCLISVSRPGDVYPKSTGAEINAETGSLLRYFRNREVETGAAGANFVELATTNNPFNAKRVVDPAPSCVDFDGDGRVDCAVGFVGTGTTGNGYGKSGIWFLNNVGTQGDPSFVEEDGRGLNPAWKDPILGLASRYGHRMTCADLDGNGLIDCIVANEGTCVITYLNNTGTKERPQLTPLAASVNPFLDKAGLLQQVSNAGRQEPWSHYNGTYCPARMVTNNTYGDDTYGQELRYNYNGPFIIKGAMSPACADFDLDGGELHYQS